MTTDQTKQDLNETYEGQAREEWLHYFMQLIPVEIETAEELVEYFRRHHPELKLSEADIDVWSDERDEWRWAYEQARRKGPSLPLLLDLFARWREMRKLEEMPK